MSRTVRRKKFNSKRRFFIHYWECFSEKEVQDAKYIESWKYHSDNYYTKSCKDRKQDFKKIKYKASRQEFRMKMASIKNLSYFDDNFDVVLRSKNFYSVAWCVH